MKQVLIIGIFCSIFSCNAQLTDSTFLDTERIEYFDIKKFNEQANGKSDYTITDDEGNQIQQFRASSGGYVRRVTPANSNITYITTFYPNGNLRSKAKELFSMFYGQSPNYDIKGKLISTDNYDEGYKVTIEEIRQRVLNEFGLDILLKDSKTNVHRSKNTFSYLKVSSRNYNLYWIIVPADETNYFYQIEIDADTGEELGRMRYWSNRVDNGTGYMKALRLYREQQIKEQGLPTTPKAEDSSSSFKFENTPETGSELTRLKELPKDT